MVISEDQYWLIKKKYSHKMISFVLLFTSSLTTNMSSFLCVFTSACFSTSRIVELRKLSWQKHARKYQLSTEAILFGRIIVKLDPHIETVPGVLYTSRQKTEPFTTRKQQQTRLARLPTIC